MLVASILLSLALTIVLNLVIRAFPGATERGVRRIDGWAQSQSPDRQDGRRVQVFFPWKAMLIGSIALTLLVNVLARAL